MSGLPFDFCSELFVASSGCSFAQSSPVSAEVMTEIRGRARAEWPDDAEMREWTIANEIWGYKTIADMDWGPAIGVSDAILKEAEEFHPDGEACAGFVTGEVEAFTALASLCPDDVPASLLAGWKAAAAREHDWYQQQLDEVESWISQHRYVAATRVTVEQVWDLLTAMERVIGSECHDGNIQNYSAGGRLGGGGPLVPLPRLDPARPGCEEAHLPVR